jgi:hypothetical protein
MFGPSGAGWELVKIRYTMLRFHETQLRLSCDHHQSRNEYLEVRSGEKTMINENILEQS